MVPCNLGLNGMIGNLFSLEIAETDMVRVITFNLGNDSESQIRLGRTGQPEDIVNLAAFLYSDRARHITGKFINIYWGQYIWNLLSNIYSSLIISDEVEPNGKGDFIWKCPSRSLN